MKKGFIYLGAIITISLIAVVLAGLMLSLPKNEPIACTMEAKLCPDGSAVGRTGPRCEFAPCPEVSNQQALSDETIQIVKDFAGVAQNMDQYLPLSIRGKYNFSEILLLAVDHINIVQTQATIAAIRGEVLDIQIADAPEGRAFSSAMARLCLAKVFIEGNFADAVSACRSYDPYPTHIDWEITADDLTAEMQILPYLIAGQARYFTNTDDAKAAYYLKEIDLHNLALSTIFSETWQPSDLYQRILSEAEINSWQTYRNEEYGFEVKYPPAWQTWIPSMSIVEFDSPNPNGKPEDVITIESLAFQAITQNATQGSLNNNILPPPFSSGNFLGKKAYFYSTNWELSTAADNYGVFIKKFDVVEAPFISIELRASSVAARDLENQILSTFKFIEPNVIDTSTWQTYRNEEYGFEFKYPSNFETFTQHDTQIFMESRFKEVKGVRPTISLIVYMKGSQADDEFIKAQYKTAPDGSELPIEKRISAMVMGRPLYKLIYQGGMAGSFYVINKDWVYEFYWVGSKYGPLIDSILSTLKFIEPTVTSGVDEVVACSEDTDCVLVARNCCTLRGWGQCLDKAVNKNYVNQYLDTLRQQCTPEPGAPETACPAGPLPTSVYCQHIKARCVENVCQIAEQ